MFRLNFKNIFKYSSKHTHTLKYTTKCITNYTYKSNIDDQIKIKKNNIIDIKEDIELLTFDGIYINELHDRLDDINHQIDQLMRDKIENIGDNKNNDWIKKE